MSNIVTGDWFEISDFKISEDFLRGSAQLLMHDGPRNVVVFLAKPFDNCCGPTKYLGGLVGLVMRVILTIIGTALTLGVVVPLSLLTCCCCCEPCDARETRAKIQNLERVSQSLRQMQESNREVTAALNNTRGLNRGL